MKKLVELKNIKKSYRNKKVLNNISGTIEEKQIIAILGGNGSGKSTFLRLIAGIERPDSGEVLHASKNPRIGYVPERFPKYLRFTPSEYLYCIGRMSGVAEVKLQQRIPAFLHRFQLDKWGHRRISDLSKGNIQKVGIIQAILQPPDLFILDEPLSGLDISAQQELLSIISELNEQGTTILLTYHEAAIFDRIVDQTYYIKNGVLTEENVLTKEVVKLIEAKHLDKEDVEGWKEVLYLDKREDSMLLYVSPENCNQILARILELRGNIESVNSTDFKS